MKTYVNPPRNKWRELCLRPSDYDPEVASRVARIMERVRNDGDDAIKELSVEIDGHDIDRIEVSEAEINAACEKVSADVKDAVARAARNIEVFHRAQKPSEVEIETMPGVRCIQRPVPIEKIGLYIPGGTAPLFSTVLMLAVPARIAECREIVMCTPSRKDGSISPEVLYAASFCGIKRIFALGGAVAIAAMGYGTGTVPKVDKVFGPGNRYVTAAKQQLSLGVAAIDMPAGPSEVMVLADTSANASFVASDLLSQAEHGSDSQVMLVCDNEAFAEAVQDEVGRQTVELARAGFVSDSLSKSSTVIFDNRADMVEFANMYAPEHLIISMKDAWCIADRITAAGSVFVGAYSPESAGDYASGTNHTLPTCGWARSFSGVNVDSFMRKMTLQELTRNGLESLAPVITAMAEAEGLQAHANAVKIRINAR